MAARQVGMHINTECVISGIPINGRMALVITDRLADTVNVRTIITSKQADWRRWAAVAARVVCLYKKRVVGERNQLTQYY